MRREIYALHRFEHLHIMHIGFIQIFHLVLIISISNINRAERGNVRKYKLQKVLENKKMIAHSNGIVNKTLVARLW